MDPHYVKVLFKEFQNSEQNPDESAMDYLERFDSLEYYHRSIITPDLLSIKRGASLTN